jgi:hypothetical protein
VNKPIEKPEAIDTCDGCPKCGGNIEWPCICDNKYPRPAQDANEGDARTIAAIGYAAWCGAPGR